ncbi:hypothetical protein E2C01_021817 [Portunus trituberculatus]|uniref:Uncharacterized protein n=1 Tax=Portunus trituberculatus TaxID=210409 RepID=A0A5B7E5D0_PORTR|nr:hypothetical protein [Portunus trituberculatus]
MRVIGFVTSSPMTQNYQQMNSNNAHREHFHKRPIDGGAAVAGGYKQVWLMAVLSGISEQGPTVARHLTLNMPPKHPATSPAMSPSVAKKTRKSLTLEVKRDIIQTREARKLIALLATMA